MKDTINIYYPYDNIPQQEWFSKTSELISEFPIDKDTLVDIVLKSWDEIFTITNSSKDFAIGINVFPKPQIMGFFLEEIITHKLVKTDPLIWQADPTGYSKDLLNLADEKYSIEIKTSSSKGRIYGNRSYGQAPTSSKKSKDGYYLAINYEKFTKSNTSPGITEIRFGFLNHSDWKSQNASSGQAAHIPIEIERVKLHTIWKKS